DGDEGPRDADALDLARHRGGATQPEIVVVAGIAGTVEVTDDDHLRRRPLADQRQDELELGFRLRRQLGRIEDEIEAQRHWTRRVEEDGVAPLLADLGLVDNSRLWRLGGARDHHRSARSIEHGRATWAGDDDRARRA